MKPAMRVLLIGSLVVSATSAAMCSLLWREGYEETYLKGPVVDTWSVPAIDPAPVVLPGAAWASIPARTADGKVAGWIHEGAEGKFIALDEATGRVLWHAATGPVPDDLVRSDGWRRGERVPAVAAALAGPGVYLVAANRKWMLIAEGGGSVKTGDLPAQIPALTGAACLVDGNFWLGIADERDGGVMLSAAGVLADVRSDRPAGCFHAGDDRDSDLKVISPLQNAHADPTPYPADDHSRGYPPEVCGRYSKTQMKRTGNAWCSDMRTTDGDPKRSVMLHISDIVFRQEDDKWLMVRLPDPYSGGIDFKPSIVNYELSWPRAFFDMTAYRNVTSQNNPSATSFEAKKVEQRTEVTEIVASIARTGELQWARSIWRGDMPRVSADFSENWFYTRSLLLASHPSSPAQTIYAFKPGMLLAIDQATGAPRFQVGTSLAPPTW
ncbi:hypothetical protein [Nannocystis bainbridge]|uniref:PQQ-like domain-containing protein n=1 Tax=Nannocystis bainbridge TaxID=2995303 RepID=A0ABT5E472_9BACT|nr:hypothetical protein [Nannocystis bainbridge]MDC0720129.1 hypothetical protein [Nannocystis bainbridge]